MATKFSVQEQAGFSFIDQGTGPTLILLHGVAGQLSNWERVIDGLSLRYRVIVPSLPIHDRRYPAKLESLLQYTEAFVEELQLDDVVLVGNSLGGHIGLLYTLAHPSHVRGLVLAASSGLYERNYAGSSFPRRHDYSYISKITQDVFFDKKVADKVLLDECYKMLQDPFKVLRVIKLARVAQQNNLSAELPHITTPTLLVWGLNDTVTPPRVAYEFYRKLPNARLNFIDNCCHAPMMEHPDAFVNYIHEYIGELVDA